MSYKAGTRYSNDTYIMTETTDEGVSAVGEINGEPVEFSGGGSGFEVAHVSVINDGAVFPVIEYARIFTIPTTEITGLFVDQLLDDDINDVVLADGAAILMFPSESLEGNVVTGSENIEIIEMEGMIIVVVSGDGTITFSVE